jgi:GNAT superfamily N-acetyltransferase
VKPRRRHRAFVDLTPADCGPQGLGDTPAFLGRFDEPALRRELAGAGILEGLARKGHADVVLDLEASTGEHRLRVFDRGDGHESLLDLRLSENAIILPADASDADSGVLSVITITWLSLQNPGAAFTRAKPRLPGQRHPGLGVGRALITRLLSWAAAWGKDGLVNLPMYFHNASLYAAVFDFVSPRRQGLFEALTRDLSGVPLAEASAAVTEERIVEYPSGRAFRWEAGEMLAPLTERARAHAANPRYRRTADAVRDSVRFRIV